MSRLPHPNPAPPADPDDQEIEEILDALGENQILFDFERMYRRVEIPTTFAFMFKQLIDKDKIVKGSQGGDTVTFNITLLRVSELGKTRFEEIFNNNFGIPINITYNNLSLMALISAYNCREQIVRVNIIDGTSTECVKYDIELEIIALQAELVSVDDEVGVDGRRRR